MGVNKKLADGVNVFGPFEAKDSNGKASILGLICLRKANVVHDKYPLCRSELVDKQVLGKIDINIGDHLSHKVNLFYVNARRVPENFSEEHTYTLSKFYNIGYWVHDVKSIPVDWSTQAKYFQEIWVPSNHVQNSVAKMVSVPVITMPYPVEERVISPRIAKKELKKNNPSDDFIFLSIFNTFSDVERKNIVFMIKAFLSSFEGVDNVKLVLKIRNIELAPIFQAILLDIANKNKNIIFIDAFYDDLQMDELYNGADAYISLHRAEGFGFTIAEAISRGIPVIATAYSGNMDFCVPGEVSLIKYKEVVVGCERTLMSKFDSWAEPDMYAASFAIKDMVVNHSAWIKNARGARDRLRRNFSIEEVGRLIKARIDLICSGFHCPIKFNDRKIDVLYDISNKYGY